MNAAAHHPRRQIYVNRTIQGRMLRRFALMWFVYHFVLWNAMFLYRYLQYRGELLAGSAPQPFAELYSQFFAQHYSLMVCSLAVLPVLLWDMVRMTHRVAGPLVRFQKALGELAEGRTVDRIQIRDGDLLLEFQDAFNEFLERTGMLKRAALTLRNDPPPHSQHGDDPAAVVRELDEIRESVARGVEPSRDAEPSRV
jgi:hypothetical protein